MNVSGDSNTEFRYQAFISYRHGGQDGRWALWLHRALESYRIPRQVLPSEPQRRRIGRCFRDEEELSASADLSQDIVAALRQSRYLIVVCSPRTPGSEWVDREIRQFREWGRHDRILSLLVEGEPAESFPSSLREIRHVADQADARIAVEPLAADVRHSHGRAGRGGRQAALLRLAAKLIGVSYDELRQREQQRQNRWTLMVVGSTIGLALVMTGLAGFALIQKLNADTQRGLAQRESQRAAAQVNALTLQNGFERLDAGDLTAALPWFAEALRQEQDHPDRSRVHRLRIESTLDQCPHLMQCFDTTAGSISPDGTRIAIVTAQGIQVCDLRTKEPVGSVLDHIGARGVAYTPDGDFIVSYGQGIARHAVAKGTMPAKVEYPQQPIGRISITADADKVLAREAGWPPPGEAFWLELSSGAAVNWLEPVFGSKSDEYLRAWESAGSFLISAIEVQKPPAWRVQIWDIASEQVRQNLEIPFKHSGIDAATLSRDGTVAALKIKEPGSLVPFAQCWSVATGKPLGPRLAAPGGVSTIDLSPDGRHLLLTTQSELGAMHGRRTLPPETRVYETDSGRQVGLSCTHEEAVENAYFSPTGISFVTLSQHECRVWETITAELQTPPLRNQRGLSKVQFEHQDRFLLTSGGGTLRVWDLARGTSRETLSVDHAHYSSDPNLQKGAYVDHGKYVCTVGFGKARVWDGTSGRLHRELSLETQSRPWVTTLDANPNTPRVAIVGVRPGNDEEIVESRVFNAVTGAAVGPGVTLSTPKSNGRHDPLVVLDARAERMLITGADGSARVFVVATGQPLSPLLSHDGRVTAAVFSADGRTVGTGTRDGTIREWRVDDGSLVGGVYRGKHEVTALRFGVRRFHLAASTSGFSSDGRLLIWTSPELDKPTSTSEFPHGLPEFAVSPDETQFATAASDGNARIWAWDKSALKITAASPLLKHPGWVNTVAFDSSGALLITGGGNPPPAWTTGFARIWSSHDGVPVTPWITQRLKVMDVEFHPSETGWLTAGDDAGHVAAWRGRDWPLSELMAVAELTADARIDSTGGLVPLDAERQQRNLSQAASWLTGKSWATADRRVLTWHREQSRRWEDAREWAAVIQHLTPLIDLEPNEPLLRSRRGRAHVETGSWNAAIRDCTQAIERGQPSDAVFYFRGRAHAALKDWTKAESDLQRAVELANVGDEVFLQQADADYVLELAAVQAEQGHRKEAARTLGRIGLAGQEFQLQERAEAWQRGGFSRRALAAYDRLLVEEPEDVEMLRARAAILQSLGEFALARADISQILANDEENSDDWLLRAELAVLQSDWTAASADFAQAVQRGSRKSSSAIGWILAPLIAGDREAYLDRCSHIITAALHSPASVRTNFACCLLAEPDTFESIDPKPLVTALRADLAKKPSAGTEIVLYAIEQRQGNHQAAIEHLTRLVNSAADISDREFARSFLIKAHVAVDNKDQARKLLTASSQTDDLLNRQNWWWASLLKHLRAEAEADIANDR